MRQATAAEAEHRIELVQLAGALRQLLRVGLQGGGDLGDLLVAVRQELVQRRIEQPDRDRQPLHDLEQLDEIARAASAAAWRARPGAISRRRRGSSRARRGCAPRRRTCARCGKARCPRRRTSTPRAHRSACRHWRARRACAPCRPSPSGSQNSPDSAGSVIGTRPSSTWPVEPSMVMTSPALKVCAADAHGARRRSRRAACRRRRRRACPCRAPPRRRARSCRRGW